MGDGAAAAGVGAAAVNAADGWEDDIHGCGVFGGWWEN